jgi:hypothetical protein
VSSPDLAELFRQHRLAYFGPRWGPRCADGVQVPTPLGEQCLHCDETVVSGDIGVYIACLTAHADAVRMVPTHAECEALGILGHKYGVCECDGPFRDRREAARELWRRMAADPRKGL